MPIVTTEPTPLSEQTSRPNSRPARINNGELNHWPLQRIVQRAVDKLSGRIFSIFSIRMFRPNSSGEPSRSTLTLNGQRIRIVQIDDQVSAEVFLMPEGMLAVVVGNAATGERNVAVYSFRHVAAMMRPPEDTVPPHVLAAIRSAASHPVVAELAGTEADTAPAAEPAFTVAAETFELRSVSEMMPMLRHPVDVASISIVGDAVRAENVADGVPNHITTPAARFGASTTVDGSVQVDRIDDDDDDGSDTTGAREDDDDYIDEDDEPF